MRIGIFTQFNEPFRQVANITVPVMQEYADRHGYTLHVGENLPITRSIVWDRYKILHEHVNQYDWLCHMDADVLITNLNIPLEQFCQVGESIVISMARSENGSLRMNDGVALFSKNEYDPLFLEKVFNGKEDDFVKCGQDYLEELYFSHGGHGFALLPQKCINSFLYTEYGMSPRTLGHWTPGDFVLHAPGRTNERRVELFTEYSKQIIR